jgi:hypothetical protein
MHIHALQQWLLLIAVVSCLQDMPGSCRRRLLHSGSHHTHVNRLQHPYAQEHEDLAAVSGGMIRRGV